MGDDRPGVPDRGRGGAGQQGAEYFHFAFIDNVVCAQGFKPRFGIVHCDFETLERTVKDSGHWYAEVIRTNGAALHEHPADVLRRARPAQPAVDSVGRAD